LKTKDVKANWKVISSGFIHPLIIKNKTWLEVVESLENIPCGIDKLNIIQIGESKNEEHNSGRENRTATEA